MKFFRGAIGMYSQSYPFEENLAFLQQFIANHPITKQDIVTAVQESYQERLITENEYSCLLKEMKDYLHHELTKEEVDSLSKIEFEEYYQNYLQFIQDSFTPLSKQEQKRLTIEELCCYRKRERLYLLATKAKLKGLIGKEVMHPFLYGALFLYHLFHHISIQVNGKVPLQALGKKRRPIILAVSHIGLYDTEVALQALKKHFYLLSDDEEFMYRTFDGWFFDSNGVIYVDNDDRVDKRVAFETAIKYLKAKKNILWCPEAIWNLDINKIILYLAYGIIEAAYQGDALILPIGIEQFDQEKGAHFVVNIRDFIDVKNYFSLDMNEEERKKMKLKLASELRDSIATLKYEAWEQKKREEIGEDYYQKFVQKRLDEWPYFNLDIIKKRTFQPKDVVESTQVFEHLNYLDIDSRNAFLARIKKDYQLELKEKENLMVRP